MTAHSWEVTPAEARQIQQDLKGRVVREDDLGAVRYVAGTDVAFEQGLKTTKGAVAVLSFPDLELEEYALARRRTSFPYVPGLLSFREIPVLLEAIDKLHRAPDLVLCDGQGYAHPRRFGLACHLGVLTGLPTIGVAKSRLIGTHSDVPEHKGDWTPLMDGQELLAHHAGYLVANPAVYVTLEGHTDERGSREYNIALGDRRALSVQRVLELNGVAPEQVTVVSYGEEKSAADGNSDAAWRLNRRVELLY